jgi:hypothetical protein
MSRLIDRLGLPLLAALGAHIAPLAFCMTVPSLLPADT